MNKVALAENESPSFINVANEGSSNDLEVLSDEEIQDKYIKEIRLQSGQEIEELLNDYNAQMICSHDLVTAHSTTMGYWHDNGVSTHCYSSIEAEDPDHKFRNKIKHSKEKFDQLNSKTNRLSLVISFIGIMVPIVIALNKSLLAAFAEHLNPLPFFLTENSIVLWLFTSFLIFYLTFKLYLPLNRYKKNRQIFEQCNSALDELSKTSTDGFYCTIDEALDCYLLLRHVEHIDKDDKRSIINISTLSFHQFLLLSKLANSSSPKIVFYAQSDDRTRLIESLCLQYNVEVFEIKPLSGQKYRKLLTDAGASSNQAEKLSLLVEPFSDAIPFILSCIVQKRECLKQGCDLEVIYNPAISWKDEWVRVMSVDSDRVILDLRMLIALLGSCTVQELSDFADSEMRIALPTNWQSLIECSYVRLCDDNRFRALSFTRHYFYSMYESDYVYKTRVRFDSFKPFALDKRWKEFEVKSSNSISNSKVNEKYFAFMLDIFALRKLDNFSPLDVSHLLINHLSAAESFEKVIKYLASGETYSQVRTSYLRGNQYGAFGALLVVEYMKTECDYKVDCYPYWLVLKAEMLRGVGLGKVKEALTCSYKAQAEFMSQDKQVKQDVSSKIQFFEILHSIFVNFDPGTQYPLLLGRLRFGLDELSSLFEEVNKKEVRKDEIERVGVLYGQFALLTQRRFLSQGTYISFAKCVTSLFGEDHTAKNIDFSDLHSALVKLTLYVRFLSLKMNKTSHEERLEKLEDIQSLAKSLCEEYPKSPDALKLYFLALRLEGFTIYRMPNGKGNEKAANLLLQGIDERLKEHIRNREKIGEHITMKADTAVVFMEALSDVTLVVREYNEGLIDKKSFSSVYEYLNSEVTELNRDGRFSPIDQMRLQKYQSLIEDCLDGEGMPEVIDPNTLHLESEQKNSYQVILNDLGTKISQHRYFKKGPPPQESRQVDRYYRKAFVLWLNDPRNGFGSFAKALAMKFSNGMYALRDFQNQLSDKIHGCYETSFNELMTVLYDSHTVGHKYLRARCFLPCKISNWSEFGIVCESKSGNKVFVPRLLLTNDYKDCKIDYCSPITSRFMKHLHQENFKWRSPPTLILQSMGGLRDSEWYKESSIYIEIAEKAPKRQGDFVEFIKECDAIGTMRGKFFVRDLLNEFFVPDGLANFKFDDTNVFLTMSNSKLIIRVPDEAIEVYRQPRFKRLFRRFSGLVWFYAFPESMEIKDVATDLITVLKVPAEYDEKNNRLHCYYAPQDDPNLQFLCSIMGDMYGSTSSYDSDFWNNFPEGSTPDIPRKELILD